MNFNDVFGKNNEVMNKIDEIIEERETKSHLEILEEKTEKTVKLLNKFAEQIPSMIIRIEKASKYIELDSVEKLFSDVLKNTNTIVENQKHVEHIISDFSTKGFRILEESNQLLEEKSNIFRYINWVMVGVVIFLVIFILIST